MAFLKKKNKKIQRKIFSFKALLIKTALILLCVTAGFYFIKKDYIDSLILKQTNIFHSKTGLIVENIILTCSNDYCPIASNSLVENLEGKPMLKISLEDIQSNILRYNCVEDVEVSRKMPNTLEIKVKNKEPIAILQSHNKFFFITDKSEIIKIYNTSNIDEFIIFTGKQAEKYAPYILKILSTDETIFSNIDAIMRVGDRRWDIRLKNGTEVKLPEKNLELAWSKFIKFYKDSEESSSKKPQLIDLRIPGKIYSTNK